MFSPGVVDTDKFLEMPASSQNLYFNLIRQQVPIVDVAWYLLKPGRRPNIFSYPGERTASIKVYPETKSFFDFGRGIGGDAVKLWTHVRGCDSWTAAQVIASIWGLELEQDSKITAAEARRHQQAKLRSKQEKERAWKRWRREVDLLKIREKFYTDLLNSPHIKPFSDPWCWAINDLQVIRHRLDFLCGIEQ